MRETLFFIFKILFAGGVVAFTSWLAGRKPGLAGFIVALPMISMLSILFSYLEYRDMQKINQFAVSILLAVPLSLTFFLPFILNRWLRLNFIASYGLALAFVTSAYLIHHLLTSKGLIR